MARSFVSDTLLDTNGNAIVGAKVYLFASGTATTHTEPTAPTGTAISGSMYSVGSGGSPVSNPLTTNSDGYWEAYLASNQRLDTAYSDNNHSATVSGTAITFAQFVKTKDALLAPSDEGGAAVAATTNPYDYLITWDGTYAKAINGRTGTTDYGGSGNNGGATGTLFASVWNAAIADLAKRGPTRQFSTGVSASRTANVTTYTTTAVLPRPQDYVTVTGYVGDSTLNCTQAQVTAVSTATPSFSIAQTGANSSDSGGTAYATNPGGTIFIQNIQTGANSNNPIPVKSTLYTCDGLTILGSGITKALASTSSGTGATIHPYTGSVVLQATATFTSKYPDGTTSYTDGKVLLDARGGTSAARTSANNTAGRENLTILNLGLDGGAGVCDIPLLILGMGSANNALVFGCQIRGGLLSNVQIGASNDTGGSSDVFFSHCDVQALGGSPVNASGLFVVYVGDSAFTFSNIVPAGNTHAIIVKGGSLTRFWDSHVGGGGGNYSDIKLIGGQNVEIVRCYIDNIGSANNFRAGIVIEQASNSLSGLVIRDNYFNTNGSVPAIMFDFVNGSNSFSRVEIQNNRANGNRETISNGAGGTVDCNIPAIVSCVGGNIRSRNTSIRGNNFGNTNSLVTGDTTTDSNYTYSQGNRFAASSNAQRGGGQYGVLTSTINASTTTVQVSESITGAAYNTNHFTPAYINYGTEAAGIFIPFDIVIGTEKMCVTARSLVSNLNYSYTVTRGVGGTTAATHTVSVLGDTPVYLPMCLEGVQEQSGKETLASGTVTVTHSLWGTPRYVGLTLGSTTLGDLEVAGVGTVVDPSYITAFAQGTFVINSSNDISTKPVYWRATCDYD